MPNSRWRTLVSSSSARTYGVIVSASNEERTRHTTIHRAGSAPRELVREVCGYLDALPGRWYVDSISTPDSVYRDVIGEAPFPYYSERQYLGIIGRLDLLREPVAPSHGERVEAIRAARTGKT